MTSVRTVDTFTVRFDLRIGPARLRGNGWIVGEAAPVGFGKGVDAFCCLQQPHGVGKVCLNRQLNSLSLSLYLSLSLSPHPPPPRVLPHPRPLVSTDAEIIRSYSVL